ncbi:methyltransferase domain-containing protein [Nostoc parmelioides]|uniref:Methyltransferase domain-containing protein n=1 Tax=Nostoc parmelioides FACHB-3921 TaxID=2692909 RepID=A0ABR8BHG1_9NOSO|nr:methyltransferase domain-containing protein [Nostoc parmelioides]MBD2253134.1 methyltransferase domain-containing protein [Nostoc parmelioides FACHB-3921]
MSDSIISQNDIHYLKIIRKNIIEFMKYTAVNYAHQPGILLDIAPQIHSGARPYFSEYIKVETFDIDTHSGCTYIGDICQYNDFLKSNTFDYIVCTEVLEHTLHPFKAVDEILRILKPNGKLFLSVPFNFRIHGPLPDCWRFTEHGLRVLLEKFYILELNAIETPERQLMPIHYTVVAQK